MTKQDAIREIAYTTLVDRIRHDTYVGKDAITEYRRDLEKLYGTENHPKVELLWRVAAYGTIDPFTQVEDLEGITTYLRDKTPNERLRSHLNLYDDVVSLLKC